jgi:hypothetical protein
LEGRWGFAVRNAAWDWFKWKLVVLKITGSRIKLGFPVIQAFKTTAWRNRLIDCVLITFYHESIFDISPGNTYNIRYCVILNFNYLLLHYYD